MKKILTLLMLFTLGLTAMAQDQAEIKFDELKHNFGTFSQKNPVQEYKFQGFEMFEEMIAAIQNDTVRRIFSARVKTEAEVKRERVAEGINATTAGDGSVKKQPRKVKKIGRNDPYPCGSGKKYKNCCGR